MRANAADGRIWLGLGNGETTGVAAALHATHAAGGLAGLRSPALILPAHGGDAIDAPLQEIEAVLSGLGIDAVRTEPPSPLGRGGGDAWRDIPLPRNGVRLGKVRLPAAIVEAPSRIAVAVVRPNDRATIALDVIARFVHPRLRLLFRATAAREALSVEVNLACRPDLVLLCGSIGTSPIAAVTRDLIAAELFGLALREDQLVTSLDLSGPWEDRLVQRATELDLGIRLPGELRLHPPADLPHDVAAALDRLRLRLGLPAIEPPPSRGRMSG